MQPYINAPPGCLPERTERAVLAAAAVNERKFSTFMSRSQLGWRPFEEGNDPPHGHLDGLSTSASVRSRLAKASSWVARGVRCPSDWDWFWSAASTPLPDGLDVLRCPCCGQESGTPSLATRSRDSVDFRHGSDKKRDRLARKKKGPLWAMPAESQRSSFRPAPAAGQLASQYDSSAFEEYCRSLAEPEQEPCADILAGNDAPNRASKSFQLRHLLPTQPQSPATTRGQAQNHEDGDAPAEPASRPGSSSGMRRADPSLGGRNAESLPQLGRQDDPGTPAPRGRSSSVTRLIKQGRHAGRQA